MVGGAGLPAAGVVSGALSVSAILLLLGSLFRSRRFMARRRHHRLSSSKMVPVADESLISPFTGLVKLMKNDSALSFTWSARIAIVIVAVVAPGAKVTVPVRAV